MNGDGLTYYEQYNSPNVIIKPGDSVYIKNEAGKQQIVQVDTIWVNKE